MYKLKIFLFLLSILIISANILSAEETIVIGKLTPELINAGEKGKIEISFDIPKGFHQSLQKDYFFIEPFEVEGIVFEPTVYPKGIDEDSNTNYYNKVTLIKMFFVDNNFKSGTYEIKVIAGYQFCDDQGMCHFPEEVEILLPITIGSIIKEDEIEQPKTEISTPDITSDNQFTNINNLFNDFTIGGVTGGYQKGDKFITFLDGSIKSGGTTQNKFAGKSLWLVILLIIVGGIALNLTPCVLPMIPITIAVLGAGTQAESKGRGFLIGSMYGLGMTLAYGTLGLLVVLTGSQFGAINSSPWFNLIIGVIFIILALAMFNVIPVDFSKFRSHKMQGKSSKGKFITVFILGVIAAILAGACIAPVLISVILYSTSLYAKGNPAGLLLPFLLGIGMAIPWPFAGAGLSVLPKPGKWMEWIKYIFGVIILIIAIYYGYTGIKIFKNKIKVDKQIEIVKDTTSLQWIYDLPEGLKKAKQEEKPVLIDFWATWCKNCIVMDATTFKNEEIMKKLEDYIVIKYIAEDLKESPTKEILNHFGIIGLPSYVVLVPK